MDTSILGDFRQAGLENDKKLVFRSLSIKGGEVIEPEGGSGGGYDAAPVDFGAPEAGAEEGGAAAWGAEPEEAKEEGAAWGEPEPDAEMADAAAGDGGGDWGEPTGEDGAAAGGDDWGTGGGDDAPADTGDNNGGGEGGESETDWKPNWNDGPVSEVTVHYADLTALRLLGIISLDNYDHLKVVPLEALGDVSIVINVFKTIIKKKGGCKLSL